MPKSKSDSWKDVAGPRTPLQKSAFMDNCVEWLIAPPGAESFDDEFEMPSITSENVRLHEHRIAYDSVDLRTWPTTDCALCKKHENCTVVTGFNPFSQRHQSLLCDKCLQ